jgi:hypothetical protein
MLIRMHKDAPLFGRPTESSQEVSMVILISKGRIGLKYTFQINFQFGYYLSNNH